MMNRLRSAAAAARARLAETFDTRDVLFFGGLALVAAGVAWQFTPAAALIVVGSVLVALAKWG